MSGVRGKKGSHISRREACAFGLSIIFGSIAGCSSPSPKSEGIEPVAKAPSAEIRMDTVFPAELPRLVLRSFGPGSTFDRTIGAMVDEGKKFQGERPPYPENRHLAHDKSIFQLSYEIVDSQKVLEAAVKLGDVDSLPSDANVISFQNLPDVDTSSLTKHPGMQEGDLEGVRTEFTFKAANVSNSVLVPQPEFDYIEWENGNAVKWVVQETSTNTYKTYLYEGNRITSTEEYGEKLIEAFAFELPGLTSEEKRILKTAIAQNQYTIRPSDSPPEPFASLVEKITSHQGAHTLNEDRQEYHEKGYILKFQGRVFWVSEVAINR